MQKFVMLLPLLLLSVGCEVADQAAVPASSTRVAVEDSAMPSEPSDVPPVDKIEKVTKSEDEWKQQLSEEEYYVLRKKGTERAFTGEYDKHFEPGSYACAACGLVLFEADTKFNSGCGWPAFYAAKAGDRVVQTADYTLGMVRTEVTCARCDSHLGHIFDDAPQTPTGQRYCINSVSLDFISQEEMEKRKAEEEKAAEVVEANQEESTESEAE